MNAVICVRHYADTWIARVNGWPVRRARATGPEDAARAAAEALAERLAMPNQSRPQVQQVREIARSLHEATYLVDLAPDS
jgi:hypothetical protein